MLKDPIVEEVRAARAQIAQECDYDLERLAEHASNAAAKVSGLRYVTRDELLKRKQRAQDQPLPT